MCREDGERWRGALDLDTPLSFSPCYVKCLFSEWNDVGLERGCWHTCDSDGLSTLQLDEWLS
jgi:hypothetical protein